MYPKSTPANSSQDFRGVTAAQLLASEAAQVGVAERRSRSKDQSSQPRRI